MAYGRRILRASPRPPVVHGHVKRTYRDAPGVDAFSLIDRLTMPVLGLYGDADAGIPSDDVRRFEAELRKRNPDVEFILHPGAPHAFFSDDRTSGSTRRRLRRTPGSTPDILRQAPSGLIRLRDAVAPEVRDDLRGAGYFAFCTSAHCLSWRCVTANCHFSRMIVG